MPCMLPHYLLEGLIGKQQFQHLPIRTCLAQHGVCMVTTVVLKGVHGKLWMVVSSSSDAHLAVFVPI